MPPSSFLWRRSVAPCGFPARQRRTGAAVAIAVVAPPADHCLALTSLAVEKAAVWDAHPQAPTKGFTGRRGKAMLYYVPRQAYPRSPSGSGGIPGMPPAQALTL